MKVSLKFFVFFLSLILFSCSTQKEKFRNRLYHRLNAKYNALFYAKESFEEALDKLYSLHDENYNEILPVRIIGNESNIQKIYPQLDCK